MDEIKIKEPRVHTVMSEKMLAELDEVRKRHLMTRSGLIRHLVEMGLARYRSIPQNERRKKPRKGAR